MVLADNGKHLDRDLLISSDSFLSPFTRFHAECEALTETLSLPIQVNNDGTIFLLPKLEQLFLDISTVVKTNYQKLLSFQNLIDRLSDVYEIKLSDKIDHWLHILRNKIQKHNDSLTAAQQNFEFGYFGDNPEAKIVRHWKTDLTIQIEGIKPDDALISDWVQEFDEVLKPA